MSPVIPHLAFECLNKFNDIKEFKWPDVIEEHLKISEKIIVIQINGKKRNTITIKNDIEEEDLIKKIKEMKLIDKYIKNEKIHKTVYVKNKLINIIIK